MCSYIISVQVLTSENFDFPDGAFDKLFEDEVAECWPSNDRGIREALQHKRLYWTGLGSANAFETFLTKVLPKFTGKADLLVFWEGSEVSGLRVQDGKVVQCDVSYVLTPQP